MPAGVRRGLHHEAAQRLAAAGYPALQVAEQFSRGSSPGDAEAVSWLTRAAREAAPRSPEVAGDLLGCAAGLMDPQDPGRDRLLVERAATQMWTSLADAERECRELLGRPRSLDVDGAARSCRGQALLGQGRAREALRELEQAHREAGLSAAERALAQAWTAVCRLSLGEFSSAAAMAARATADAIAAGEPLAISMAMSTQALAAEYQGNLAEAAGIIEEAVRLAGDSTGGVGRRYPVLATQGHVLMELDRLPDALQALGTGMVISEQLGARWHLPTHHNVSAAVHFAAGDWDEAIADLEASSALAGETRETYTRDLACGLRSLIALHRNDLSAAAEAASRAAGDFAATGPLDRAHWAVWAQALLLEAAGDLAGAFAALTGVWEACHGWGSHWSTRCSGLT